MFIRYDIPRLGVLIENLFTLTGVSLSVLDTQYRTLVHCAHPDDFCSLLQRTGDAGEGCKKCDSYILEKCSRSGKLERHICTAGLYDSAMPIVKHGTVVGYVLMGRVRSVRSPEYPRNLPETDPETEAKLRALYSRLPAMTEQQLSALYALLPSILFDNAIRFVYDPLMTQIVEYIADRLQEELSVTGLCKRFHISANRLYDLFRENLDKTVNDYIVEQRLAKAKMLLSSGDDPVYTVAEKVGIGNYPYFCRLFKKRNGVTPAYYRKMSKKY